jgi:two-component system, OmpR family, sensor kinase
VSLRTRLMIGLMSLAAVGLLVLAAATYKALRDFEVDRVDGQASAALRPALRELARVHALDAAAAPAVGDPVSGGGSGRAADTGLPGEREHGPGGPGGPGTGSRGGERPTDLPPAGTYAQQRDAAGRVVGGTFLGVSRGETVPTAPKLPRGLALDEPQTIRSGIKRYRVYATRTPMVRGQTTIVAIPFTEADATLSQLLLVEGLVIAAVLGALGAAVWWIVRFGLRPLDRIGETAGAIAGGDLSRRVEPAEPRTEVGRLGLALNAMLARLEQAFDERHASEERLRRFLADASHELRTPLASIRGYAELFRIGAARDGPEMEQAMSRIESESARMGILVEDLLALARLDEVRDIRRELVDMAALASDAVEDARAVAPEREIELRCAADGSVVLDGDASQLRQVLANLMRNALVHTPAGSPIEVTVSSDGAQARVEVRDHGPGLPDGDPAKLFGRFWRADPGRGRGRAGAGLGLAIVAAIVAVHGGRAEAAAAPGGGACFTVALPLRAPAAGDGHAGEPAASDR